MFKGILIATTLVGSFFTGLVIRRFVDKRKNEKAILALVKLDIMSMIDEMEKKEKTLSKNDRKDLADMRREAELAVRNITTATSWNNSMFDLGDSDVELNVESIRG
jgi:hypothetical protein